MYYMPHARDLEGRFEATIVTCLPFGAGQNIELPCFRFHASKMCIKENISNLFKV